MLITDQVLLFVEIYQTRASLPQKLLQKLMNPEMNSEIETEIYFRMSADLVDPPIYIFKDGKKITNIYLQVYFPK